ncbi:hypothetical protein IAR55_006168 [Kwoniella newhampshirensis]|uniref:Myb-like domain-containing protein n=1 Tax=Kwoniella newhampshirensis TaxID=1651941 RepID=A0AAW0YUW2_9TREE
MSNNDDDIKPVLGSLSLTSHTNQMTRNSDMPTCSSTDYHLPSPSPTPRKNKNSTKNLKRSPSFSPAPDSKEKKPRTAGKKGRPAGVGGSGAKDGRKTGSWTKKEVRELWDAMSLLPAKVKWDEIANKVEGRDKLSCSNKWRYDLMPKLEAFIDSLGDQSTPFR